MQLYTILREFDEILSDHLTRPKAMFGKDLHDIQAMSTINYSRQ